MALARRAVWARTRADPPRPHKPVTAIPMFVHATPFALAYLILFEQLCCHCLGGVRSGAGGVLLLPRVPVALPVPGWRGQATPYPGRPGRAVRRDRTPVGRRLPLLHVARHHSRPGRPRRGRRLGGVAVSARAGARPHSPARDPAASLQRADPPPPVMVRYCDKFVIVN